MITLHRTIEDRFGITPVSFRAGRWGFGSSVAKILLELGYRVDTSITPFCDWGEYMGPDFGSRTNFAYAVNDAGVFCFESHNCATCSDNEYCLLEIPPTIGFLQSRYDLCYQVRKLIYSKKLNKIKLEGILDRLKLLNYRWLSPETTSFKDMKKLTDVLLKKGHMFINLFFHSTSLYPGKSPFVKNDDDLSKFYQRIESYLQYLSTIGVECITLSKLSKLIKDPVGSPVCV